MKVKVKLTDKYQKALAHLGQVPDLIPKRATDGAAGFDLVAAEEATVYCGQKATISCGFNIEVEAGFEAQVRSRSGLAKNHNVFVINTPGTIDSDYRGEVFVMLFNLGALPLFVKPGDRIAQMVIHELPAVSIVQVDALSETRRGEAGFGSTGR